MQGDRVTHIFRMYGAMNNVFRIKLVGICNLGIKTACFGRSYYATLAAVGYKVSVTQCLEKYVKKA